MILKRKKFKQKQLILKLIFLKNELKLKILKSLKKNMFNNPIFRLSFNLNWFFDNKFFFKTLQKLTCPFSLSKRVPNKHYHYSRFFLNKKLNSLNISNVYK